MTLNELRKTKDYLRKKGNELIKQLQESIDKVVECQNNQFDSKATWALIFSIFPYVTMVFVAFIASWVLTRLRMSDILLNIPKLLVLTAFIIPSATLGIYFEKKFSKQIKSNEITGVKTEEEKLEEEMRYRIESAKTYNRVEVIKEALNDIDAKEKIIITNGDFYTTQTNNKTDKEQVKDKVDGLSSILESNFDELDTLSTQSVLAENFKEERLEGRSKERLIIASFGYGMVGTMYTLLPFMALGLTSNGVAGLIAFFAIYGVNAAIFGGYEHYRTKMKTNVFKKLNSELDENALTESSENVLRDITKINTKKEMMIKDAATTLGLLEEQKKLLELASEEIEMEYECQPVLDGMDKHVDLALNSNHPGYDRDVLVSVFEDNEEKIYGDTSISETQGPTLVKKDKHKK